jgi:hypothetical protein
LRWLIPFPCIRTKLDLDDVTYFIIPFYHHPATAKAQMAIYLRLAGRFIPAHRAGTLGEREGESVRKRERERERERERSAGK